MPTARKANIKLGIHINNFLGMSAPDVNIGTNITVGTPAQCITDVINPAKLKLSPFSSRKVGSHLDHV